MLLLQMFTGSQSKLGNDYACGTGLPEIVGRSQALDASRRHADAVAPDGVRLIILLVHADPDALWRQAVHLRSQCYGRLCDFPPVESCAPDSSIGQLPYISP